MIDEKKLLAFRAVQIELKRLKAEEAALRVEITDELLKHRRVGTHTFHYGDIVVKATKKVTITPDEETLKVMYEDMTEDERRCFKYKPAFVASEYKKLSNPEHVDKCITSKPAMPTLEVKIPETV